MILIFDIQQDLPLHLNLKLSEYWAKVSYRNFYSISIFIKFLFAESRAKLLCAWDYHIIFQARSSWSQNKHAAFTHVFWNKYYSLHQNLLIIFLKAQNHLYTAYPLRCNIFYPNTCILTASNTTVNGQKLWEK